MSSKAKRIVNYIVYCLLGNGTYGILLYLLVTSLARVSPLLAYVGNLAFIFAVVGLDEFILRRQMQPEKILASIQKQTSMDNKKAVWRQWRWSMQYFISFKSFLLVFYILVLVFAQILRFYPTLAGENLTNFINAIDYSVLILVAFNDFRDQFSRDKERSQTRLDEAKTYLAQHMGAEWELLVR